ncbi:MAG: hypothetical protein WCP11_02820 [Candidatus Saccharibacteria bacterium]
MIKSYDKGSADIWMITTICFAVLMIGASTFGVWAYMNYNEQKTDVDGKIGDAVALAKKEQGDEDEKKFAEREKEPNREFSGPEEYGQVSFSYPKTWGVYVATEASIKGGSYEAYFNPIEVPPVKAGQQYALRLSVVQKKSYDEFLKTFESSIKKGELKSSSALINDIAVTRLDGNFSKDIRGSMVVFPVRDKLVTIQTDADTFKPDFDALIKTIKFNA